MTPRNITLLCLAVLSLAGCATSPTSTATAEPATSVLPAGGITPDRGTIAVTRDTGIVGSACVYYLYVDGEQVASVKPGQRVEFGADPGERIVTAAVRGICGGGTANVEVAVSAGQTKYLRAGATQTGDIRLEPAAPGYR